MDGNGEPSLFESSNWNNQGSCFFSKQYVSLKLTRLSSWIFSQSLNERAEKPSNLIKIWHVSFVFLTQIKKKHQKTKQAQNKF